MTLRFCPLLLNLLGRTFLAIVQLCLLIVLGGCQTATFHAARLPVEYRCPPVQNTDFINLARLSGPGFDSALIGPGDLLEVTVSSGRDGEDPKPWLSRVADDGSVSVPIIGVVPVAGLEPFEASQNVASAAVNRGVLRQPHVSLNIKTKAVNRVTVLGAVSEPGVHELPQGSSDVVNALAAAGGPTEEAGTIVEILRQTDSMAASTGAGLGDVQQVSYQHADTPDAALPSDFGPPPWPNVATPSPGYPNTYLNGAAGPTSPKLGPPGDPRTTRVDLATLDQLPVQQFGLGDRDVVMVFPREDRVIHVGGLVKEPGQFEIPKNRDMHLLDAIALAGGKSSPVADKVFVIRRIEGRPEPLVIKVSIAKAKRNGLVNLRLASGDMVSVEQTPSTIVVDTVMNFFRVSFGLGGRAVLF